MIRVCDKATELQFSVLSPLYLPFYNQWGANAYYRYDAFSLDPFHLSCSCTSGSPVLLTPYGFFGFLNEAGGRIYGNWQINREKFPHMERLVLDMTSEALFRGFGLPPSP